jgi:hypothetical protein
MATTTNPQAPQQDIARTKPAETAGSTAQHLTDKAKDAAANVADKARETASNLGQKARDAASAVGQKAEDATRAVGSGMESLAGSMRENLPHSGVIGGASSTVADTLETSGRYLEQEGLAGMAEDVMNFIRRNPLPAFLVGIGVGFMAARLLARD